MDATGAIFIVGGGGMLGAPVARALRAAGRPVRILAREPGRARTILGDGFTYVQGDVEDEASLVRAYPARLVRGAGRKPGGRAFGARGKTSCPWERVAASRSASSGDDEPSRWPD